MSDPQPVPAETSPTKPKQKMGCAGYFALGFVIWVVVMGINQCNPHEPGVWIVDDGGAEVILLDSMGTPTGEPHLRLPAGAKVKFQSKRSDTYDVVLILDGPKKDRSGLVESKRLR